jgi:hypothetical protein
LPSIVTHPDQPPAYINVGDRVVDSFGRDFIAQTSAEKDQYGMFNVMGPGMRWIAYEASDRVTLTYDEDGYPDN